MTIRPNDHVLDKLNPLLISLNIKYQQESFVLISVYTRLLITIDLGNMLAM